MPQEIRKERRDQESPFRKRAVFVVHGIGEQEDTDTAVSMRWGIEDALGLVELENWDANGEDVWILPAPYVYDGYWAKYADLDAFEDDLRSDLDVLTARQRQFFEGAWRDRTLGWWRSLLWLTSQGIKLVRWAPLLEKPFYSLLTILVFFVMLAAGIWPTSRKFLVTYVNDARLYFEPNGDFEHEMVQLIDRRVGRAFLKTIGLDWKFEELDDYNALVINGLPHRFDKVVWVSHSLGTVISFNVIGDILSKCIEIRHKYAKKNKTDYCSDCPPAERVERALAAFVTIGSPIDKVCFLYKTRSNGSEENSVLRSWPNEYLPGGALDLKKTSQDGQKSDARWWINCFYGSDPISGPLDTVEQFMKVPKHELITNISPLGLRIPLQSHVTYWRDTGFVTKLLEVTYSGFTKTVRHAFHKSASSDDCYFVRSWPRWMHGWLSGFGLFWITMSAVVIVIAVVLNWEHVWSWFQEIFK